MSPPWLSRAQYESLPPPPPFALLLGLPPSMPPPTAGIAAITNPHCLCNWIHEALCVGLTRPQGRSAGVAAACCLFVVGYYAAPRTCAVVASCLCRCIDLGLIDGGVGSRFRVDRICRQSMARNLWGSCVGVRHRFDIWTRPHRLNDARLGSLDPARRSPTKHRS